MTYSFSYMEPVCCSMSNSNCWFLTCIQVSQEADQVVWYSQIFKNFPQFVVIHTVKGFGIVNKTEIDDFLELSCFFDDPADVGNLISGSSAFSKTSLNIRFTYCWSLVWRILGITLLVCEMSAGSLVLLQFCAIICVSKVIDIFPGNLDSSPAFLMMYSAYKLNKQDDSIQPWCTPFPIWNQSVVPCPVLTVASWPAYRFLKRQVRWSGIPISFRILHSLLWST